MAVAQRLRQAVERAFEQFVGRQRVGVERVERRRLDRDRAPVRAELVGDDLRQRGPDALPVLGLRHRDGDMPVLADLEPGAERRLARFAAVRFGA